MRRYYRTENLRPYRGVDICRNYGGWVIVDWNDYNIYASYESAKNAVRKGLDGTHKREPRVIGRMTVDQFIHALNL